MVETKAVAWPAPSAMHREVQQISSDLEGMTQVPGRLGSTARQLIGLLEAHQARQEAVVLPPLGLLAPLSRGALSKEMAAMLPLTDRLRRDLPRLLDEHLAIARLFDELATLARLARRPDLARLTRQIETYALVREQVIYPAALLAGDAVRFHFGNGPRL